MAELKQAATMASWPRPLWTIGCPSNAVAIAAGVPGVLTSTAGIASENIAQTYRPPNMAMPDSVGSANVNGTSRAVPIVAVRPGRVPTTMPIMTPTVSQNMTDQVSVCMRPSITAQFPSLCL